VHVFGAAQHLIREHQDCLQAELAVAKVEEICRHKEIRGQFALDSSCVDRDCTRRLMDPESACRRPPSCFARGGGHCRCKTDAILTFEARTEQIQHHYCIIPLWPVPLDLWQTDSTLVTHEEITSVKKNMRARGFHVAVEQKVAVAAEQTSALSLESPRASSTGPLPTAASHRSHGKE
jgi:hypothetical protein